MTPMQVLQMLCLFQWQINIENVGIASFVLVDNCVYGGIVHHSLHLYNGNE
jgi:hypothetical protein